MLNLAHTHTRVLGRSTVRCYWCKMISNTNQFSQYKHVLQCKRKRSGSPSVPAFNYVQFCSGKRSAVILGSLFLWFRLPLAKRAASTNRNRIQKCQETTTQSITTTTTSEGHLLQSSESYDCTLQPSNIIVAASLTSPTVLQTSLPVKSQPTTSAPSTRFNSNNPHLPSPSSIATIVLVCMVKFSTALSASFDSSSSVLRYPSSLLLRLSLKH